MVSQIKQLQQSRAPYQHTTVRDIHWLLTSPTLFAQSLGGFEAFNFELDDQALQQWLASLDNSLAADTSAFPDEILRRHHRRLGLYFEALLQFCLTQGWEHGITPFRLLEHNTQINVEGITSGEIDLLVRHNDGRVIHVEAAVKYYLAKENAAAWDNWIGPNARDRLDLKLSRLLEHQLPLLTRTEAKPLLLEWQQKHGITTLHSQFFLRGVFFKEVHNLADFSASLSRALPNRANQQVLQGAWCKVTTFLRWEADFLCWPCKKMEWFTGPKSEELMSVGEVKNRLVAAQNKEKIYLPQMLYVNLDSGYCPVMLVEDHWPE